MRIFFDAETISERGTSVAIFDYARFAEEFLNAEVVIGYKGAEDRNAGALKNFTDRFTCIHYSDQSDLISKVKRERVEFFYRLTSGRQDSIRIDQVWTANHIVFQHDRALPDACAYVSEWLSKHTSGGSRPFVPHIVDLPQPNGTLRSSLRIPEDAFVVGRHGGYTTFDIPFVSKAISRALDHRRDLWFVMLNTEPFLKHERIIYLPGTSDPIQKANFINTCDVMLHARKQGETFGLAMAEFQFLGKPALCWRGGTDQNHIVMQTDQALIYFTAQDLYTKLVKLNSDNLPKVPPEAILRYQPEIVMKKFESVFLSKMGNNGQNQTNLQTRLFRSIRKEIARNIGRTCEAYSRLF
jgi:hypothetical protein